MKNKLSHACYWLFIMLVFTGCAVEMDIIDPEQNLDQGIERIVLPDAISYV